MSIEEYATRLFREWRVGQAAIDNGVLVLIAPTEREMRIEVGYGLDPVLPDGLASAIIREDFQPSLRDGNFEEGILQGVGRIAEVVRWKHILTPVERAGLESSNKPSLFGWFLFGTFGLLWLSAVGMSGLMFGEAAKLKRGPQMLLSLVAIGIFAGLPIGSSGLGWASGSSSSGSSSSFGGGSSGGGASGNW